MNNTATSESNKPQIKYALNHKLISISSRNDHRTNKNSLVPDIRTNYVLSDLLTKYNTQSVQNDRSTNLYSNTTIPNMSHYTESYKSKDTLKTANLQKEMEIQRQRNNKLNRLADAKKIAKNKIEKLKLRLRATKPANATPKA